MITTNHIFRTVAAAAVALPLSLFTLSSCSDEDDSLNNLAKDLVSFTASVSEASHSRANIIYTPTTGNLTVYANEWASTTKAEYGYGSAGWTCTSHTPLYWKDVTGTDEFVFFAVAPAEPGDAPAVMPDQSAEANFIASDLLVARTAVETKEVEVPFTLKHVLSQLVVNLSTVTGDEGLTADELASTVMTIDGLKTAYTLTAGTTADAPVTVEATGEVVNGLKPYAKNNTYSFLTVPQTGEMTLHFTVTIDGKEVKYVYLAEPTFAAGKKNIYNLSISKSNLKVGSVVITDWADGTPTAADLKIAVTGTADELTGEAGNINELYVTPFSEKQINKMYEGKTEAHTYNKDEEGNWSSTNPIYLDNLAAGYVLYASAYNLDAEGAQIQDAVTGLYDYLGSDAVTVKGGAAAFALRHLHAQMTVQLAKGEGFTADIEDATITTPTMATAAQVGTDAEGNIVMKATNTTGTYTVAPAATHLVVNQTLAAGSVFTVTLQNGNTYEAKLAEALILEAGKNTVLTLTLKQTEAGISATVKPWGEASAAAEVTLAGLTTGGVTLQAAEGDKLTLNYISNEAVALTATYTYSEGKWSADAPLYWDNIALEGYTKTFTALYVPASGTDYHYGIASDIDYGKTIAFTDLKHAMAKMTITLTGADIIKTSTVALESLAENFEPNVDATGATQLALNGTDAAIAFTRGTAFLVAPQAIDDNNVITLTHNNGNTYSVKLNTLTIDNAALGELKAGTHYALTLDVTETGVTASVTLAGWNEKAGSSDVSFAAINVGTIEGAADGDKLTLNLLATNNTVAATALYTYGDGKWSSESPIYWNNVANDNTYSGNFTAVYQAADGTWSTGKATEVAHGAAPSFSSMTQAMAKMTITLNAGDGIEDIDAEVTGRTIALKVNTATPAVESDGSPAALNLGTLSAVAFANGTAFAVAPQTLTDENVITLTRANGNQYTLKLNTLTDVFGTDGIEAGQHYKITLTVNETAVGVSATLAPWTEKTGTGTMTPEL